MTVGIYGIFDAKTDECLYVGMSKNIEQRQKSHLKELKSKRHKRQDFVEWYHNNGAVQKLLSFRILEECEANETVLNLVEIKWFNKMTPKYYGKKPSLNEKWEHSAVSKDRLSAAQRKNCFHIECTKCGKMFYSIKPDTWGCLRCKENKRRRGKHKTKVPKPTYCKNCKSEKFGRNRFCSDECKKEFHNNKCLKCDMLIEKDRKFCSKECYLMFPRQNSIDKPATKGLISYDDLYQMYVVEKLSTRQIALKTGYSNVSIQNWLRSNNIEVKTNPQTIRDKNKAKFIQELPDRDELLKYYNDRLSFDEIGKRYNTNRDKVRKWVKHYDFPPRNRPHKLS